MPFNTRNSIPSGDLRDLDDNARNIDTWANDKTKLSHPDRFGVERRTWHGIEKEANLNIQQAIDAKNAAQEAAMMSGFSKYADTLVQLEAGIGSDYVNGDVVMVFQDESRGGSSSIYKVESGVAVFKNAFDKTREDLLSFTGNISADAEWSDVPAHSDPAFDAQTQALANRAESLLHRFDALQNTSSGEEIKGAIVGYEDYTKVASMSEAEERGYPIGTKFTETSTGTVFEVVSEPPVNGNYPIIPIGDYYALPVANHWAANYGAVGPRGIITGTQWISGTGSAQGIEYDARAGTILQSVNISGTSPEVGYIIEYAYSPDGGIGAEIGRTSTLPMGHTEYFAIIYNNGVRYLVFGADDGAGTYTVLNLRQGSTGSEVVGTFQVPQSAGTGSKLNIRSCDGDKLYVSRDGRFSYVCLASDILSGKWEPLRTVENSQSNNLVLRTPGQLYRSAGDLTVCLSGLQANKPYSGSIAWGSGDMTERYAFVEVLHGDLPSSEWPEQEGLSLVWNPRRLKFEAHMNVWRSASGAINYYNYTDDAVAQPATAVATPFTTYVRNVAGTWIEPRTSYGLEHIHKSITPLEAPALYIGGFKPSNRTVGVDPVNFAITQWNWIDDAEGQREGGVIKYRGAELLIDSERDSVMHEGIRFFQDGITYAAFTANGTRIGANAKTRNSGNYYQLHVETAGAARGGIYVRPTPVGSFQGASFVSSSGSIDYGVVAGESMQLGAYDSSNSTYVQWYTLDVNSIRPAQDNAQNLGAASLRYGTIYAGTGTINTSDERTKTDWRTTNEAERAAAADIKAAIKGFKFTDAVAKKGESARWHFGVGAQTVGEILKSHGLNPADYAFWCHDVWDDTYTQVSVLDDNGEPTGATTNGELLVEAGERYGIRYEELIMFILTAM